MGLSNLIHKAVEIAADVTEDLQADITHEVYTGDAARGVPQYSAAVTVPALIQHRTRYIPVNALEQQVSSTQLTITSSRVFKNEDRITLPDGTTPRILDIRAMLDGAGVPYLTEIFF